MYLFICLTAHFLVGNAIFGVTGPILATQQPLAYRSLLVREQRKHEEGRAKRRVAFSR